MGKDQGGGFLQIFFAEGEVEVSVVTSIESGCAWESLVHPLSVLVNSIAQYDAFAFFGRAFGGIKDAHYDQVVF